MKQVINERKLVKKIISLVIAMLILGIIMLFDRGGLHIINPYFVYIAIACSVLIACFILLNRFVTLGETFRVIYFHVTDFAFLLISAIAFLQFIFVFIFFPAVVDGPSMLPTLNNRDFLIVRSLDDVDRFDIVVVQINDQYNVMNGSLENKDLLIKRVIGIAGDHIAFVNGILYVNDVEIDETYLKDENGDFLYVPFGPPNSLNRGNFDINEYMDQPGYDLVCDTLNECVIPEEYYFVMGDNRNNSYDSSRGLGLFHKSQIKGFPVFRMVTVLDWERVQG